MHKHVRTASILLVLLLPLLFGSTSLAAGPERDWYVTFTYDVPGYWPEGDHAYRFEFGGTASPNPLDGVVTVSDEAPLYQGRVLLRGWYALARDPGSNGDMCAQVDQIHPDQPTRFHLVWRIGEPVTRKEAKALLEGVTLTVEWDGGDPVPLKRHQILPWIEETTQPWEHTLCSWTVRQ